MGTLPKHLGWAGATHRAAKSRPDPFGFGVTPALLLLEYAVGFDRAGGGKSGTL